MKTEYHIEIYEPNDDRCVAASYKSESPFMAINVGNTIAGASLNLAEVCQTLRVTEVEHIFWEIDGSHKAHKICLFTEIA
ncbi:MULTISPECIES: hypothetical protein [unclassified Vibrio]|uniref:hypothetical protein n=1 Tax=unclassified Vibrio TaxID=2614977 RepID=UPI000B8E3A2E|nr:MULTISPECIES: hypothetical protein [unclassified Vibrio]NAW91015.1 hypothetical protein [Vibrio sp. V24_P1S3T111]OXX29841.1 hypothetical protein B9J95_12640 [Vibrio sp. V14_P6S14T42]OXX34326.1 hypothetical protein B9J81_09375 [Vibrio sp. V04_P4A5T148]OXX56564.1 hypothetical protein B9J91_06655 [Vibrio sp. V18_P1S4T112]